MKKVLVLLAVAALIPAAGASGAGEMEEKQALKLRSTRYGPILFDANNRVLYGFTRDKRGGKNSDQAESRHSSGVHRRSPVEWVSDGDYSDGLRLWLTSLASSATFTATSTPWGAS